MNISTIVDVLHYIPGFLCVVNKPHDVMLDGDSACTAQKLAQRAVDERVARATGNSASDEVCAPEITVRHVHQLDYATSGVLCYGLSRDAAHELSMLFSSRQTRKTYLALVWGHMPADRYVFDAAIAQPPENAFRQVIGSRALVGRPCLTHCHVAYRASISGRPVTYVVLIPRTGIWCSCMSHASRVHNLVASLHTCILPFQVDDINCVYIWRLLAFLLWAILVTVEMTRALE